MKIRSIESALCKSAVLATAMGLGLMTIAPVRGQEADSPAMLSPATAPIASAAPATTAPSAVDGEPLPDAGSSVGEEGSELMLFKDIPVVVAAGMREQTLQQAPASVSIVTADDIELFNYRSVADVLRAQRSFYIYNDGLNDLAGVRGLQRPNIYNSQILVLEDGCPTNELVYGASGIDQGVGAPMEAIKRIEIVRGPGSSLYGTNAMFGVVNVVTKDGADVNGVIEKTEAGTDETIHQNILYGQAFKNGWDVLADITGYSTAGDRDIVYDGITSSDFNFGHIRNGDAQYAYSGFAKFKNGPLTFQIDSSLRQTDDSAATYLTSFFNPGWQSERRLNATLHLDKDFGDGQELHALVSYAHYDERIASPYDTTEVTIPYLYYTNADDDFLIEQIHYGWQATRNFHLLAGADGTEAVHTRQDDSDTINGSILNVPASYSSYGLFAEGQEQFTRWLSVTVGARFDEVQRVGNNVSPRFAAILTPTRQDTFKALYGSAFRSPTLSDLLYQTPPPSGVITNPDLKPEKIDTYELAWERQYDNGWQTTLDGYLWNMADPIYSAVLSDGSTQQQNGTNLWAHGIEVEADKKWDSGASLRAYGSYSHATQDGAILIHSPVWITGASLAVPVYRKNNILAIEPQFVGQMKNDLGEYTPPTFITNVVFTSREFAKGWTFQAGVYNLFGNFARLPREGPFNQVEDQLHYQNPEAMVSLSYKF